jgi:hypothetical protein
MANNREHDSTMASSHKGTAREQRERVIKVPTPTEEQRSYLEEIRRNTGHFDPDVVVGGPRPQSK